MTSSRNASVCGSSVFSKAHPRELPACGWREEVAVRSATVPARSRAACALEHELPAHELAVIFADSASGRSEAGVGGEGAPRPLPDVAEHSAAGARDGRAGAIELVADHRIRRSGEIFPFGFGGEARAGPAGESVGFEIADVCDGRCEVDLAPPCKRELGAVVVPIKRFFDALAPDPFPAFAQPQGRRSVPAVAHELSP